MMYRDGMTVTGDAFLHTVDGVSPLGFSILHIRMRVAQKCWNAGRG